MATLTLAAIRAPRELAGVRIRFVAIGTQLMWNRSFEIAVRMTFYAADLKVLS